MPDLHQFPFWDDFIDASFTPAVLVWNRRYGPSHAVGGDANLPRRERITRYPIRDVSVHHFNDMTIVWSDARVDGGFHTSRINILWDGKRASFTSHSSDGKTYTNTIRATDEDLVEARLRGWI
jgi:hypothetical protein